MKKGFTLIELLVVFAIIAILLAIIIPIFNQASHHQSNNSCQSPQFVSAIANDTGDIVFTYNCADGNQVTTDHALD